MPVRTADVVVVGGGLVGSALAYELVTRGASTILVDRHDRGRATDAGAGILSPETNLDSDPGAFTFGMAAARHHTDLTERLIEDGIADTGLATTGSLVVAERAGDDPVMDAAAVLLTERSPGLIQEVDPEEAKRLFPPLGRVRRALFNPAARRVDGRVLNAGLRSAALSRGLEVIEGTATIEARGESRVDGVVTDEGPVSAATVVVAGGAWSEELGTALGVPLPVSPLKGQIVHLALPDTDSRSWPIVQPVLSFYLVPWAEGRVACGGTLEAEAGFDHRVTADGLLQLLRECLRTAPGLAAATMVEVRVGSRPATRDGRPVVGRLPGWTNVFAATGHGTEGLLLGPYSAAVVADLVLGSRNGAGSPEETALVLERCSPDRFTG
jgi:D-amino-acid dehydrogenase